MSLKLIRLPVVLQRTGLKRSKLYDLMAQGAMPKPVKIGSCAAWPEPEIEAWIEARIAEREAA